MQRKLKAPAIYKHFKDKFYCTMGESNPIEIDEAFEKKFTYALTAKHTESGEFICIYMIEDRYYHNQSDDSDKLVVYKSLHDGNGPYARPLCMFLGEVDTVKYPSVDQKYRMELVGDLFEK